MGTKKQPGKFDCYANALDDEPMFVLLARDDKASENVRLWASQYKAEKERANDGKRMTVEQYAKYSEALDCADAMEAWRKDYNNQNKLKKQAQERADAIRNKPEIGR